MNDYRKAISAAANDYGLKMPDALLNRFATAMKAESDGSMSYFKLEDMLREFEHDDSIGCGKAEENLKTYLDGGEREAPKKPKRTVEEVSSAAMGNLDRIVVCEAAYHDRFYAELSEDSLPTAMHRTQESVRTALSATTETGNGSDNAWLYHHLGNVRKIMQNAPSYLNRETTALELNKETLDKVQEEFAKLEFVFSDYL